MIAVIWLSVIGNYQWSEFGSDLWVVIVTKIFPCALTLSVGYGIILISQQHLDYEIETLEFLYDMTHPHLTRISIMRYFLTNSWKYALILINVISIYSMLK